MKWCCSAEKDNPDNKYKHNLKALLHWTNSTMQQVARLSSRGILLNGRPKKKKKILFMLQKCHDFRRLAHSLLSKLSHIPHIWFNNQMSCMKGSLLLIAKHWTPQCFSLIIPPGLTLWRLFICLIYGVMPLCLSSTSICKSSFFPFLSFFFFALWSHREFQWLLLKIVSPHIETGSATQR